ncbi:unnamed protein product [Psylliodes chrysocephalus]|uniref:HTH psq-type domain-containing protein n=1 Tax=Psylliodes chrysocephalus TaxID=3402493 RepID=A0A9P0CTC2_9CUCU|nr:unnamed protein product [Psylliodes chrysocephala]
MTQFRKLTKFFASRMSSDEEKGSKPYGQWCLQDMKKAVNAYKAKKYGLNETCRVFNISKATFKRHLESKNKFANKDIKSFGRKTVFSKELEDALASDAKQFYSFLGRVQTSDVIDDLEGYGERHYRFCN